MKFVGLIYLILVSLTYLIHKKQTTETQIPRKNIWSDNIKEKTCSHLSVNMLTFQKGLILSKYQKKFSNEFVSLIYLVLQFVPDSPHSQEADY